MARVLNSLGIARRKKNNRQKDKTNVHMSGKVVWLQVIYIPIRSPKHIQIKCEINMNLLFMNIQMRMIRKSIYLIIIKFALCLSLWLSKNRILIKQPVEVHVFRPLIVWRETNDYMNNLNLFQTLFHLMSVWEEKKKINPNWLNSTYSVWYLIFFFKNYHHTVGSTWHRACFVLFYN